MVRGVPIIFNQRHYLGLLGFSPITTIADAGCYLSSFATIASYYGKHYDPVDLNKAFQEKNLFVIPNSAEIAGDSSLQDVFPDIIFQESLVYPNEILNPDGSVKAPGVPADLNKLTSLMADPNLSVILEIDIGGGNTHFVVCLGVNGTVTIANPWTGQQEDFTTLYGDPVKNIIKFVVYKGTPISIDQQVTDQLRQQRDKNWNLYQGQLGTTQQIQEHLNETQKTLDDANKTITDLKVEVSQCNSSVANLSGELQKKATEDQTAIDEGVKYEGLYSNLKVYFIGVAQKLGINTANLSDADLAEKSAAAADGQDQVIANQEKLLQQKNKQPSPTSAQQGSAFWDWLSGLFFTKGS